MRCDQGKSHIQLQAIVSGNALLRIRWVGMDQNRMARLVIKGMTLRHMQSGWEQGGSNGCGRRLDSGDILKVKSA